MPASIVDWAGRPIERGGRPGGGKALVPGKAAWYDQLSTDITPALIISYLNSADQGNLTSQMALFDRMVDRDDRLQAVLETRRLAVTGIEREIRPRIPEDARAEKAADLCREMLESHIESSLAPILDGVPKGISAQELVWEGSKILSVDEVPQRLLRWNSTTLEVDMNGGSGKANWQVPEPYKFLLFSFRNKPGAKQKRGLLRALSILWVAKHWALRDWAAFVEVFGMPLRLGIYPESATPAQRQDLYDALADLGADSAAIVQENMRIEFPRISNATGGGTGGGQIPMETLIDYVDRSYAIRTLGQNLTTEGVSGSGTLAGGAHENVRKDYLRADTKAVAAAIERDLFGPVVGFNLGWDYPTPKLWFDVEDPQDDAGRAKVYVEMAKIPGMTFSRSQIQREFAFDEPIDENDALVIEAPEPAEPTGLPGEFGVKTGAAFAVDEFKPDRPIPGSGMKACEDVAADGAEIVGDEPMASILAYVETLAAGVDTPEQLMRRIRLAAPNLEGALASAGITTEEFEDAVARAIVTAQYDGAAAVENEIEQQIAEGEAEPIE